MDDLSNFLRKPSEWKTQSKTKRTGNNAGNRKDMRKTPIIILIKMEQRKKIS